jgi:type II secretory pathway pseudopilin PulG
MIEIAFSLAIIGFALVAIIGVLPIGMNVQTDNREETIINQDETVFMNAIRNGAQGMDDLTNYVFAITNDVTVYQNGKASPPQTYGYTLTSCSANVIPSFPLTSGLRIVGLLSTPKYVPVILKQGVVGYYSNHVVAYVRSMSGAAFEKFPQNNPSVQDLAFSYRMTSEVIPYGFPVWSAQVVNNLQANLHDVRLIFRWPLRSRGQLGQGGQAFRTLVGGVLGEMNEPGFPPRPTPGVPSPYDLYFFQPRTYVNVP